MTGPLTQQRYDVVVVGAGHNGLVAAAYLAQAGMSVLVLERLPHTGGATSSAEVFPGVPASISPYATMVSLFPDQIVKDLGLQVQFRSRRTAAYAPVIRAGRHTGLLIEATPTPATATSFRAVTGSDREHEAWQTFHDRLHEFAAVVAPSMLEPLAPRKSFRERIHPDTWRMLVEEPIAVAIEERFTDDVVRGLVATRALSGTFVDLHSPDLEQNRTFLYGAIGNGTGEWRIPIGGMGALCSALERAVRTHDGEILTQAFVTRLDVDESGGGAQVTFQTAGEEHSVTGDWVLGNVAPWVLQLLLGENPGPRPEGAALRVNMVLDKLPRLRGGVSSATAFAGTVHLGESYEQLQQAFLEAQEGSIPDYPPGELVCPSLTDPSVMGPLAVEGKHVFSYLGLHAPARLFSGHVEMQRDEIVLRVLDVVNAYLEEPLEELLALDERGNPCLEARAPQDIETALAMPGGHIYHGPLSWPWSSDRAALDTTERRWGVESSVPRVLVCGAGAQRGGAVSGIGGHNAAMAVLEATGRSGPAGPSSTGQTA